MAKNIYTDFNFNDQDLLNVLTGIIFANSAVIGTDSVRTAIGKLQGQLTSGSGITYYYVPSIISQQITSTTDVAITSMTATPIAGTYLCLFNTTGLSGANNSIASISFYKNAAIINDSVRHTTAHSANEAQSYQTSTVVTMNGTDILTARAKVSSGTIQFDQRNLVLIRFGA